MDTVAYQVASSYYHRTTSDKVLKKYLSDFVKQADVMQNEYSFYCITKNDELKKIYVEDFIDKPLPTYHSDSTGTMLKEIVKSNDILGIGERLRDSEIGQFETALWHPRIIYALAIAAGVLKDEKAKEIFLNAAKGYLKYLTLNYEDDKKVVSIERHSKETEVINLLKESENFLANKYSMTLHGLLDEFRKNNIEIEQYIIEDVIQDSHKYLYLNDSVDRVLYNFVLEDIEKKMPKSCLQFSMDTDSAADNDMIKTDLGINLKEYKETFCDIIKEPYKEIMEDIISRGEMAIYDRELTRDEHVISHISTIFTECLYIKLLQGSILELKKSLIYVLECYEHTIPTSFRIEQDYEKMIYGPNIKKVNDIDLRKYRRDYNEL